MYLKKLFDIKFSLDKSSRHRKFLEKSLGDIIAFGKVLDIGGAQRPIRDRLSKLSQIKEYKILDLPQPHADSDQVIDFSLNIESELTEKILKTIQNNNFDSIFCIEVSLYWSDPARAMRNIANLMAKNSTLYINFHSNYAIQKPNGLDGLRYTYDAVRSYCHENELVIEKTLLTKINFISIAALNIFWKSEKMRRNKLYKYHYISSFLFELKKK